MIKLINLAVDEGMIYIIDQLDGWWGEWSNDDGEDHWLWKRMVM